MITVAVCPKKLITNMLLFLYFYLIKTKNRNKCFHCFSGLITKNIFVFCYWRVAHYFKDMSNSVDF